jgi:REP element-mobilizing transposase RayT
MEMKDLPVRKSIRLKGYNYSQAGNYFITICVKNKYELLGQIFVDSSLNTSSVTLSETGKMVKCHVENISQRNGVTLEKYVIMPNHIHLLICLEYGTAKPVSLQNATIPQIINALKGLTSKKFGESMWQHSYHDRIIRHDEEYQRIFRYIDENPQRWYEDCYYTVVSEDTTRYTELSKH